MRACSRLVPVLSVLLMAALIAMGAACKKKTSSFLKDDRKYFEEMLSADMDYGDLVDVFGEPPVDLNAAWADSDGLHIYQYPLYDSTFVRIGYTTKIEYVCLVDDRANLLQDIIVVAP